MHNKDVFMSLSTPLYDIMDNINAEFVEYHRF